MSDIFSWTSKCLIVNGNGQLHVLDSFYSFQIFDLLITIILYLCNQFTDDPSVAICSDSGGSVFVLSFK